MPREATAICPECGDSVLCERVLRQWIFAPHWDQFADRCSASGSKADEVEVPWFKSRRRFKPKPASKRRDGKACLICGCGGQLYRDHDHVTGMIRGLLCPPCNSWLGIYEANLRRKWQNGSGRYFAWVDMYEKEIKKHLRRNTGVVYVAYSKHARKPKPVTSKAERETADAINAWWSKIQPKLTKR